MTKSVYKKFTYRTFQGNNYIASTIWVVFFLVFWRHGVLEVDERVSTKIANICAIPIAVMLLMQMLQKKLPTLSGKFIKTRINIITIANIFAISEIARIIDNQASLISTIIFMIIVLIFLNVLNPLATWKYSAISGLCGIIYYSAVLTCDGMQVKFVGQIFVCLLVTHSLLIHAARTYQAVSDREEDIIRQLNEQKEASLVAREEAIRAKLAREEFIANISHEIRTPLFGIVGLTDRIFSNTNDWSTRVVAEKINRTTNHLLALVNDILDFSKLSQRDVNVTRTVFEICSLIEDASKIVESQIEIQNVQYFVHVTRNTPREITSDPKLLLQILINILGNAVKYTHEGYIYFKIAAHTEQNDDLYIKFSIEDSGVGISEQSQAKLFQPFEQGDQSLSKEFGGTGLGLALSKSILDALGGKITVQSNLGKGSKFTISVPLKASETRGSNYTDINFIKFRYVYLISTNEFIVRYVSDVVSDIWSDQENLHVMEDLTFSEFQCNSLVIIDVESVDIDFKYFAQTLEHIEKSRSIRPIILMPSSFKIERLNNEFVSKHCIYQPISHRLFIDALSNQQSNNSLKIRENLNITTLKDSATLGRRVLLADDNELNLDIILDNLVGLGYAVDFALNGQSAVELAMESLSATEGYSCFLIDMQMPGLDGVSVVKEIRRNEKYLNTPILVITANALDVSSRVCRDAGATDVLVKPFTSSSLEIFIDKYIQKEADQRFDMHSALLRPYIQNAIIARELRSNLEIDIFQGIHRSNGRLNIYCEKLPEIISKINNHALKLMKNSESLDSEELCEHLRMIEKNLYALGADRLKNKMSSIEGFFNMKNRPENIGQSLVQLSTEILTLSDFCTKLVYGKL